MRAIRVSSHVLVGLLALSSLTMCQTATGTALPSTTSGTGGGTPPSAAGYFSLVQGVASTSLPSGPTCVSRIHHSSWEPRPENYTQNHNKPDPAAVHSSLKSRSRTSDGTYKSQWDSWLLPRVGGQFRGTTDEIFQWAACKWGLPDNVIRAVAVRESTWFQGLHYSDGTCYWDRGCGDAFPASDSSSKVYCDGLAAFGHDYQTETRSKVGPSPYVPAAGMCPKTFSVLGIMSWWSPSWGFNWAGNQNGAFPFNRDSTAFAADYYAGEIRGCYNGWQGTADFTAGDLWGCVGLWYSGTWHDADADAYAGRVQDELAKHTWLDPSFGPNTGQYQCDPVKGCPQ